MKKEDPVIIGLMSGTSLDGLDLCATRLNENSFEILEAETVPYDEQRIQVLKSLMTSNAVQLADAHIAFGHFLGMQVKNFVNKHNIKAAAVASHGHTIFHQPSNGFTFQLGSGAAIAAASGILTISDFRTTDIAYGGEGAPLVPVGDKFLFPEYEYCLNIGGICNISYNDEQGNRIAFDICPGNMILNYLASIKGQEFDRNGELAAQGETDERLSDNLNKVSYYFKDFPKSLGKEDIDKEFIPLLEKSRSSVEDKLATFCEHIARQIARCTGSGNMLVTGGGAFNSFLIQKIGEKCQAKPVVPDETIVKFKEALIFAYLGYLRLNEKPNVLSSVTGASRDHCAGAINLP